MWRFSSQEIQAVWGLQVFQFGLRFIVYRALNKGGPAETAQVHVEESGAQGTQGTSVFS